MFDTLSAAGVVAAALIAPPGVAVIAALQCVDQAQLNDFMRVELMKAWERQGTWIASCSQATTAGVGNAAEDASQRSITGKESLDMPIRAAHSEISNALLITDHQAASRLDIARALTGPLDFVQQALALGDLTIEHVRAIVQAVEPLPTDKQIWVAHRVLPRARKQTVAQLRASLICAVHRAEPKTAAQRHQKAHAGRSVYWYPLDDGMAELHLTASAQDILSVYGAADTLAKARRAQLPTFGSPGWQPIDALRSDALIDLVTGRSGGGLVRSNVTTLITMDLPTALGLQDNPAELSGYGPIPAPLARALSADGKWRRLICDELTGALLDLGHDSYELGAPLTRYIQTRDMICALPTCNRPATGCAIDHTDPFTYDDTGGRSDRNNLGALCQKHHRLKHETGWQLHRDPDTEKATWTSLSGHQYPVEHHDHRSYPTSDIPDTPDPDSPYDQPVPDPPDEIPDPGLAEYLTRMKDTHPIDDPIPDHDWLDPQHPMYTPEPPPDTRMPLLMRRPLNGDKAELMAATEEKIRQVFMSRHAPWGLGSNRVHLDGTESVADLREFASPSDAANTDSAAEE